MGKDGISILSPVSLMEEERAAGAHPDARVPMVCRHENRCRYIDGEDGNPIYWPFWDKQPNYGFMSNGSSCVRYTAC